MRVRYGILFVGKELKLSESAEEVATFYAKMLEHDYTTKDVFNENFMKDWTKVLISIFYWWKHVNEGIGFIFMYYYMSYVYFFCCLSPSLYIINLQFQTMTSKERELIRNLKKCNFTEMAEYFKLKSEERKNRSKEEKKVLYF